jgi:HPt (histidine-containing phosphotransfer) domain-containing protein
MHSLPKEELLQQILQENFSNDQKMFDEIALVFLGNQQRLLDELKSALIDKNTPRIAKAAHKLRGASSLFHLKSLTERLQRLESHAKEERLDSTTASTYLERIEVEVAMLCSDLHHWQMR